MKKPLLTVLHEVFPCFSCFDDSLGDLTKPAFASMNRMFLSWVYLGLQSKLSRFLVFMLQIK